MTLNVCGERREGGLRSTHSTPALGTRGFGVPLGAAAFKRADRARVQVAETAADPCIMAAVSMASVAHAVAAAPAARR